MKILHIYKSYYPETIGGVESFIHTLSQTLETHAVYSDIFTTTEKKQSFTKTIKDQTIYYYPVTVNLSSCPVSATMLTQFKKIAAQYDLLHYHFPWPYADFVHLASQIKKPSVVTYHSDIVRQKILNIVYRPLMHRFLKKMDAIVATSPNYRESSAILQQYHDKTTVIPFGMNHSALPIATAENISHWKHRVGENFFLFVGVLRYYKGLSFLLDAIENTNIPLVIAGAGPEEIKLKKMAHDKKLKNVIFVGRVDDAAKAALYTLCKAVVVPSHLRSEAFCISLLEGLLFQKPLISTEISTGTSFVNQDGLSGIVVSPENPLQLREAMQRLALDDIFYKKIKEGVLQHYHNHFTVEKMTNRYVELYRSLKTR